MQTEENLLLICYGDGINWSYLNINAHWKQNHKTLINPWPAIIAFYRTQLKKINDINMQYGQKQCESECNQNAYNKRRL